MTRIRVYISTTEAATEVQRVAEEDPQVRSVVCLDGKAVALPISAAYDSFVRNPTGVIEQAFGHSAYRVDVGAEITEGLSWQLGLYLAHSLTRDGRLAGKGMSADRQVLATGEVDRDLNVRAVGHVAEKCRAAAPIFAAAAAAGQTITFFVPAENADDIPGDIEGLNVVPVRTVHDALGALGAECGPRAAAASARAAQPSRAASLPAATQSPMPARPAAGSRRRWVAAATALAVFVIAGGWWLLDLGVLEWRALAAAGAFQELDARLAEVEEGDCAPCRWAAAGFERSLDIHGPGPDGLRISASALTVPRFRTCRSAEFQPAILERAEVARTGAARFASTQSRGLCGIVYTVRNDGPELAVVLLATLRLGEDVSVRIGDARAGWLLPTGEVTALTIDMPTRLDRPIAASVYAVAAPASSPPQTEWLMEMVARTAAGDISPKQLERRFGRVGLTFVQADHLIEAAPPRFK